MLCWPAPHSSSRACSPFLVLRKVLPRGRNALGELDIRTQLVVIEHLEALLHGVAHPRPEAARHRLGAIRRHHPLHPTVAVITSTHHEATALQAVDQLRCATRSDAVGCRDVAHGHLGAEQEPTHHLHLLHGDATELGELTFEVGWHGGLEAATQLGLGGYEPVEEATAILHAEDST